MTTKRQEEYKNNPDLQLSNGAIIDKLKYVLSGSKGYHDKILSLITQKHHTDHMVLEFKHYDLPDELNDMFWKLGESKRIIECLDQATKQVFEDIHRSIYEENKDIHYNEIEVKLVIDDEKLVSKIRQVRSHRMAGELVVIDGIVIHKTHTLHEITKYVYKCYSCGKQYHEKDRKCIVCESKKIDIAINECHTREYEIITMQEHQKDMKSGSLEPDKIDIFVYGSLVGKFQPGAHIRVSGFPKLFNPKGTDEKINRGYNTDIITLSNLVTIIESYSIQHMRTPFEILISNPSKILNDYEVRQIQTMRKKYNDWELLNVLVNSFTDKVYGMEAIKEALLVQAVGGSQISSERNRIHILIVGDPGMAKSRLAEEYQKILIHCIMAVGYGSSGVGLTVSVININGIPRPSVGAAVLANDGHLILDELSGVSEENREYLRQCMESGIISLNKHGVNQTFNANISLLAITNPDQGRYSTHNSLIENVKISPPLLSRFDMIFVTTDNVNDEEDQKLNVFTGAKWNETKPPADFIQQSNDIIDKDLLKKYLVYAKINNPKVRISKEALKRFDNFYKDLRRPIKAGDITATRRQYEGMYRIATALARLLLKNEVTEEIAEHTIKLLNNAYESAGMKLGNSTGLNQNAIFAKDLTKMDTKKAAIEVIQFITEGGKTPRDREYIMTALSKHLEIYSQDAAELFEKIYPKLRMPVHNKYILDI